MSGYKRVNFYELCRLCATNQQKDKTHIFEEEGRKIQLQNKIQSCLSLTVCENDYLPKVVCSKCLRTLEVCYSFRQECVSSESMLSSYFKNFRYTEDFKKSGKVYIKDTSTKLATPQLPPQEPPSQPVTSVINSTSTFAPITDVKPIENVPFYTLQLPAIVTNQPLENKIIKSSENAKIVQNQTGYNLNSSINLASAIKATVPKLINENFGNVVVNANGEVLNIAQLVDFESIINQANLQKIKINNAQNINKNNNSRKQIVKNDDHIIKIDLSNDLDNNYDNNNKLPHIKNNTTHSSHSNNNNSNHNNNNNKNFANYTLKVEDHHKINQSVIFNNITQNFDNNQTFNYNTPNNIYQPQNSANSNLVTVCEQQQTSTVNLNMLNSNFAPLHSTASKSVSEDGVIASNAAPSSINPQVKQHICDICQKSFKRREHLYQHVKLHTGFRPYTCEHCHKSFMRKEHLLRHMTSHSGLKNYTCNICDKSFSRNDNLLKHKKTHDKQASYTCEVCQKQFVMKHYYQAHKLTHDNDGRCGALAPPVWGAGVLNKA